jgi:hypothetical protein
MPRGQLSCGVSLTISVLQEGTSILPSTALMARHPYTVRPVTLGAVSLYISQVEE